MQFLPIFCHIFGRFSILLNCPLQELSDVLEQLSDQTMQNQSLIGSKRKLESEMQTLHVSTVSRIL